MKSHKTKAFTLVELIIVITILAILATIGFMSFQSYTADARDANRVTSIKEATKGLEIYQIKNRILPMPDEALLTITSASGTISYQGYLGATVQKQIRLTSEIKDSKDNNYYTYSINSTKTKYQLLTMLESEENLAINKNIVNKTYARIDYTNRYPYTAGDKVGIIFSGTTNTPYQETLTNSTGTLALSGMTNTQIKVIFSNSKTNSGTVTATGSSLPSIIETETTSIPTTTTLVVNPGVKTTGFSTTLYTGSGSSKSITTGVDMTSQWGADPSQTFGGLVWIKSRTSGTSPYTGHNVFYDTIRGATKQIYSHLVNNEAINSSSLTSFISDGFVIGTEPNVNYNTHNYASWNFQTTHRRTGTTNHGKSFTEYYNPYTGFTMIKYEGSGLAGHEIPHSMGRKLAIGHFKNLTDSINWATFKGDDLSKRLLINTNLAELSDGSNYWSNNTETAFTVSAGAGIQEVNISGKQYILYGWANSYYDASNVLTGNYEWVTWQGTGTSGNKVITRAKPAAIIFAKRLDATSDWWCEDNVRGMGKLLFPNLSTIESTAYGTDINFVNDGFVLSNNHIISNALGGKYGALIVYDNDNGSGKSTYMLK